jgi:hypothetical protein
LDISYQLLLNEERKNMDCVAGEALRRQLLYTLFVELAVTYKREPTNTEKIKSLIDQITVLGDKKMV